jgi:hypothetical protein
LRIFRPAQHIEEVPFEAAEFGGLRKNKQYFFTGRHDRRSGLFLFYDRNHYLIFTGSP